MTQPFVKKHPERYGLLLILLEGHKLGAGLITLLSGTHWFHSRCSDGRTEQGHNVDTTFCSSDDMPTIHEVSMILVILSFVNNSSTKLCKEAMLSLQS